MPPAVRRFLKAEAGPRRCELPDGSIATIRLVHSDDFAGLVSFQRHLSDKTVYYRYFSPVSFEWRTSASRLAAELCDDPDHQLMFVVERRADASGVRSLIGVGRLVKSAERADAEFSITIRDDFQGMGLGGVLLDTLIEAAAQQGLQAIRASVLAENRRMLELCRGRGFRIASTVGSEPIEVVRKL